VTLGAPGQTEPAEPGRTGAEAGGGLDDSLEGLDAFENGLVGEFHTHPVLARLADLAEDDFHEVLLQRRFVSLAFTPVYDLTIDLLGDEPARRVARAILREEYPDHSGHTPSHREDLKHDLLEVGVDPRAVVERRRTPATWRTIERTFDLVADLGGADGKGLTDLRLVTFLRFWGEVLVSVEYDHVWQRIGPVLTGGGTNRSRFYHLHHVHDAKTRPLPNVSLLAGGHSDRLAARQVELLATADPAAGADAFRRVEQQVFSLKRSFYDQFLPALDRIDS
jgi:hypothetical protein